MSVRLLNDINKLTISFNNLTEVLNMELNELKSKVHILNGQISKKIGFLIDKYEVYVRSEDCIPNDVKKANDSLDRLLARRLKLVRMIVCNHMTIQSFSDQLLVLSVFPQEIRYLLFRLKELLDDRRAFRRYERYLTNQEAKDKHNKQEKKQQLLATIENLDDESINAICEFISK